MCSVKDKKCSIKTKENPKQKMHIQSTNGVLSCLLEGLDRNFDLTMDIYPGYYHSTWSKVLKGVHSTRRLSPVS